MSTKRPAVAVGAPRGLRRSGVLALLLRNVGSVEMPGANTRWVRTLETAERDAEIARLRATGMGFPEIGKHFGMSRQGATSAYKRALRETVREASEEVRATELDRLDTLYRTALGAMAAKHVVVQNGRIVRDENGAPLMDWMPRLHAIDRALRVQERRARLLGLDAPVRSDVRITDSLDSEIERLAAELGFMASLADIREDVTERETSE